MSPQNPNISARLQSELCKSECGEPSWFALRALLNIIYLPVDLVPVEDKYLGFISWICLLSRY